jgi:hypothetical protein
MTIIDCPALHSQSKHYPARFMGRVPKTVRMLRTVQADEPMRFMPDWSDLIAEKGMTYPAWTNSHGAVTAILDGRRRLGLKPDEFEITEWHETSK